MNKKGKREEYGAGSIGQLKSGPKAGKWQVKIQNGFLPNGNRRVITRIAPTEAKARVIRTKLQRDLHNGITPASGITVKAWADQWLAIRQTTARPKTYGTDASAVRKWIVPAIGTRKLAGLTRADIDAVTQAQRAGNLKSSSLRRNHMTLTKMLKDAQAYGHQVPPNVLTVDAPRVNENDREAIPLPDAVRLLRAIGGTPDPSRWLAVLLQALRPGEALGTLREAFDFDDMTMTISWQLQDLPYNEPRDPSSGFRVPDGYEYRQLEGTWCLVRPKSDSGWRVVPLTETMALAAKAWLEVAPKSEHGLMWCRKDGGPIDREDFIADWRALQASVGIQHPTRTRVVDKVTVPDQYVVHEGRHTAATILKVVLGVDDDVVAAIMGQSKIVKTYVHRKLLDEARKAMQEMDAQYAELPSAG